MIKTVIHRWLLLLVFTTSAASAVTLESDIFIYGGTPAGIMAAVQARRMGRTVALVEPGTHVGGLSAGGLGATDIGNKAAIGGLAREFYRRLGKHYGSAEAWTFEPHVASQTFDAFLREAGVTVTRAEPIVAVEKPGARIVSVTLASGTVHRAKMFIDATYEGDLMAGARVEYTVGREANSTYGETLNGARAVTPQHQFQVGVDPYRVPGKPVSGLLPFIQDEPLGMAGAADRSVQAYNFRLCLTQDPANRRSIEPPAGYKADDYELLGRYLEGLVAAGKKPQLNQFLSIVGMPHGKTDMNNNGGFSTDYIGANHNYAEADWATRRKIIVAHERYTRGFLHYLATDPRVPEALRNEMQSWGLCRDEFKETGGWSPQLYIREARRMVSAVVMSERHCRGAAVATDPVGLGAYNMDSHNCRRIVRNGRVENEGDVQVGVRPYPISYQSIIPKAGQCENLAVPVCLSATHIAYGSIRMEPVFMILGQSAATACVLAIETGGSLAQLDHARLQARLLADGQVLRWTEPERKADKLEGMVLDDFDAVKKGHWIESSSVPWQVGTGYSHDGQAKETESTLLFRPKISKAGRYRINLISTPNANRSERVPVTVIISGRRGGPFLVDQRKEAILAVGRFDLPAGSETAVEISNRGTSGYVVVDGLQLLPDFSPAP